LGAAGAVLPGLVLPARGPRCHPGLPGPARRGLRARRRDFSGRRGKMGAARRRTRGRHLSRFPIRHASDEVTAMWEPFIKSPELLIPLAFFVCAAVVGLVAILAHQWRAIRSTELETALKQ